VIETKTRSLAKTISWRATVSILSFFVSWLVTGSVELAGILFVSKVGLNTAWYFIHERLWSNVSWGLKDREINHDRPDDHRVSYTGRKARS
jgi:uncharacterized membrane protein